MRKQAGSPQLWPGGMEMALGWWLLLLSSSSSATAQRAVGGCCSTSTATALRVLSSLQAAAALSSSCRAFSLAASSSLPAERLHLAGSNFFFLSDQLAES